MDSPSFRKTLLRSAVFTMACDGEVHDDEIALIKNMASEGAYFADLDAEPEAQAALDQVTEEGKQAIENHLNELEELSFTEKQEQLIYEVILRMVYADDKVHTSEKEFLIRVKEALETEDQTLIVNFPTHLDLLLNEKPEGRSGISSSEEVSIIDFFENSDGDNFSH